MLAVCKRLRLRLLIPNCFWKAHYLLACESVFFVSQIHTLRDGKRLYLESLTSYIQLFYDLLRHEFEQPVQSQHTLLIFVVVVNHRYNIESHNRRKWNNKYLSFIKGFIKVSEFHQRTLKAETQWKVTNIFTVLVSFWLSPVVKK